MGKIVTDIGLDIVAKRLKGLGTEPLYIAWGTGTTEPVAGDTTLETEDTSYGYVRITGVSVISDTSSVGDTYQVSGTITANAALLITEWGLFDDPSVGNMICREVFATGFNLAPGDPISFVFKFQVARG